jgi:hypothetical protein
VSWVKGGLERDGNSLEGARPSSEAETHPRGRQALKGCGGTPEGVSSPRARRRFVVQCLALERGGSSPEGRRGWPFDRPPRLFWAVGPRPPWAVTTRGVVCGCRLVCLLLLFLEKGVSPNIRGPLWLSPTQLHHGVALLWSFWSNSSV